MRSIFLLLAFPFLPLLAEDENNDEVAVEKTEPGPEYREFTAKNGKTLRAKVVNRIDDDTFTLETPDGKTYKMKLDSFIKSDVMWLQFWEPEFAIDLSTLETGEALAKMGFTAIPIRNPEVGMIVEAEVGDTTLKLLLDPKQKNTILDIEPADRAGIKIIGSSTVFNTPGGKQVKAKQSPNAPFKFGAADPVKSTVLVINLADIGGANIQKEADGILGADLLPKLHALIDYSAKVLYIKP